MKPIKALICTIQNDTLVVRGPMTARQARGMIADYIVYLCDHDTLNDSRNAEDLNIFRACVGSSHIDTNPLNQQSTISFMVGSIASGHIKDFNFSKIAYEG